MASAWQGPPPATSAEPPAGVRAGVKAFALITTETLPNRAGEEESGVQVALNLRGRLLGNSRHAQGIMPSSSTVLGLLKRE